MPVVLSLVVVVTGILAVSDKKPVVLTDLGVCHVFVQRQLSHVPIGKKSLNRVINKVRDLSKGLNPPAGAFKGDDRCCRFRQRGMPEALRAPSTCRNLGCD